MNTHIHIEGRTEGMTTFYFDRVTNDLLIVTGGTCSHHNEQAAAYYLAIPHDGTTGQRLHQIAGTEKKYRDMIGRMCQHAEVKDGLIQKWARANDEAQRANGQAWTMYATKQTDTRPADSAPFIAPTY